jgi:hypothetical protein
LIRNLHHSTDTVLENTEVLKQELRQTREQLLSEIRELHELRGGNQTSLPDDLFSNHAIPSSAMLNRWFEELTTYADSVVEEDKETITWSEEAVSDISEARPDDSPPALSQEQSTVYTAYRSSNTATARTTPTPE